MDKIKEIFQALIKVFVRSNKRFPVGKELEDLERQAREVFDGALTYNLDQSKGKNLDDITVMEQTTEKNADQLIDDYLSNEANKVQPTFSVVDETKLPRADIEALPLKDREKAEAAVKKKLEAQNVQATQAKEGGETPSGPQRGRPEVVDENYGNTVYIDASEMNILMDEAARTFKAAEDALSAGNYDEARAILRYEIEDNYKYPQEVRDAAYDARIYVRRGEGMAKDMGYDTDEEAIEAMREKIAEGVQKTSKDNWPSFTGKDNETGDYRNIEYVNYLDEPGEDFGTPNSIIIKPEDISYDYANGGRVGFSNGGIKGKLMEIINAVTKSKRVRQAEAEDFAKMLDDVEQARKAGIIDEAGFKSLQRGIESMRNAAYASRMKYPGAAKDTKSALPVDEKDMVPKTNLGMVRARIEKDRQGIKSLADDDAIPVRDDTSWIDTERERLTGLIRQLKTPMLRNDRIDDLRILDEVEEAGGTEADYNRLRMEKYKGLPSKKEYKRDPEAAERAADRMFGKNKTKMVSRTLNEDQVRLLGIKEGIPQEQVEAFIKGDSEVLKRGQARGVVTKDGKGNFYIKDKYSRKYVGAPITADEETARAMAEFMKENDPEGYNEIQKIVDEINQRIDLEDFNTKGRKPNAEGGLNYLLGF